MTADFDTWLRAAFDHPVTEPDCVAGGRTATGAQHCALRLSATEATRLLEKLGLESARRMVDGPADPR